MMTLTQNFWNNSLVRVMNGEAGFMIENPSLIFTRKAKAGEYDSISDEEYNDLLNECENLSKFWNNLPKRAAGDLLLDALKAAPVPTADYMKIVNLLSKNHFYSEADSSPEQSDFTLEEITAEREGCEKDSAEPASAVNPGSKDLYDWSPKSIHHYLNRKIHGQEDAKKAAALVVYNHVEGRRSNTVFCGPTGCGKSEIWRLLAKDYKKLIRIVDASRLAADGWKGSLHLRDIFENVPEDYIKKYGLIVVLDEVDKITCETIVSGNGTDHSALVQNSLLKMLDGDVLEFGTEDGKKAFSVDCSHVSVVLLGAFEKLLKNKSENSGSIGFGAAGKTEYNYSNTVLTPDDLIEAGMRREIAGRINRIAVLRPLSSDDYHKILMGPVLEELRQNMKSLVDIDEASAQLLIDEALSSGLGVRYMRSRLLLALDELIYEDPNAGTYSITIEA